MELDAVLFDVDETLFDRRRAQQLVLQGMRQRLPGLLGGFADEDLDRAWAASDRETANHIFSDDDIQRARDARSRILLRHLGRGDAPDRHVQAVTEAYLSLYAAVDAPVDDAVQVVERCRQRYRIGVVSNAYPDVQYRKLATLGLRHVFACIVLSEEFGARKPDPAIFLEGCRRLQVDPARCLYVGDSYDHDVGGAEAAGLPCCWLNPTHQPATAAARPRAEIRRLRELLPLLGL